MKHEISVFPEPGPGSAWRTPLHALSPWTPLLDPQCCGEDEHSTAALSGALLPYTPARPRPHICHTPSSAAALASTTARQRQDICYCTCDLVMIMVMF